MANGTALYFLPLTCWFLLAFLVKVIVWNNQFFPLLFYLKWETVFYFTILGLKNYFHVNHSTVHWNKSSDIFTLHLNITNLSQNIIISGWRMNCLFSSYTLFSVFFILNEITASLLSHSLVQAISSTQILVW